MKKADGDDDKVILKKKMRFRVKIVSSNKEGYVPASKPPVWKFRCQNVSGSPITSTIVVNLLL